MEKIDYLDIAKASDIKNYKDRFIYRIFEVIPGLFSLITIFGVFIFSYFFPSLVAVFIICFCFYYLFRIFYFSLHQAIGYFKMKNNMRQDWLQELRKIKKPSLASVKNWKDIYHIIIFPCYKESKDIIQESLESLLTSDYPKERMIVVVTVEEKAGKAFLDQAKELEKEYKKIFYKFFAFTHRLDPEHEIGGKGSNVSFAGKEIKKIIDELKIPYENILISSFDIDTKVYNQYFARLTYCYLTEENPLHASYQPVPVYNNNIWSSPAFSRVVSTSNTFWQMIQQERPEKLTTYSSHSIPGKAFFEVGYPGNVVSDDSRMFWKSYLAYDGQYRVVPIYYMVSMDAVLAENFWKTALNQYKQQRRWAWGCNEIPYIMFGFLHNKKISFLEKVSHTYTILEGFWSWATAALLLFLLGWLPILLGGEKFNFTVLSFNLPILTSRIMTLSMSGMIISAILSTILLPPFPKEMGTFVRFRKRAFIFFQWLLLPVTLILFGSFPALDDQIRLMMGRYMGCWGTDRVRK